MLLSIDDLKLDEPTFVGKLTRFVLANQISHNDYKKGMAWYLKHNKQVKKPLTPDEIEQAFNSQTNNLK